MKEAIEPPAGAEILPPKLESPLQGPEFPVVQTKDVQGPTILTILCIVIIMVICMQFILVPMMVMFLGLFGSLRPYVLR